ncbi:MAG: SDR family oxidoreductase [Alistipes sp.]|uniref:SDR family oxidoreductase n=1 Tax=Alistipes sp. TaxID=1872444 RepID=UPI0025C058C4|nr:SDR family oxidoreductase [Alistipes sp.]MCD8275389.1 SDR family oxidoreductase [Alistipes sp.]
MSIQPLFDLTGKVAVVTGGGNGIGRACCETLAEAGATVVVSNRTPETGEAVAQAIRDKGGKALAVACDVLDDRALERLVELSAEEFEAIFRLNVFSAWKLCKLVVPHMARAGYGSIVNITSMASINKSPNMSAYASSKAALNHMTANLAFDFGPMNVRINCVGPGATRTRALSTVLTPEIESRMLAHTPIHRLGEPSDIAGAVLYFAAPVSEWVSGQVLFVNGGGVQTLDS